MYILTTEIRSVMFEDDINIEIIPSFIKVINKDGCIINE